MNKISDDEYFDNFFELLNIKGKDSRFSQSEWVKLERIKDVALAVHFDRPLRICNPIGKVETVLVSEILDRVPNWREFPPALVIITIATTFSHLIFPEYVESAREVLLDKFYGDDPESYLLNS